MNKLMSGSFICVLVFCSISFAQTREQKVKDDKTKNEASGFWHYNNFTKGVEDAKINKKPMMIESHVTKQHKMIVAVIKSVA